MPKTSQNDYIYRKKGLVHEQNKGYNIKVRATQYIQHL